MDRYKYFFKKQIHAWEEERQSPQISEVGSALDGRPPTKTLQRKATASYFCFSSALKAPCLGHHKSSVTWKHVCIYVHACDIKTVSKGTAMSCFPNYRVGYILDYKFHHVRAGFVLWMSLRGLCLLVYICKGWNNHLLFLSADQEH